MNDNTINESSKTEDTDNENDEIIAVRNRLEKRPDGVVRQTISNAIAVLNNDPLLKGAIRRNELSCKTDIVKEMDWRRRSKTFTDTDFNNIMLRMEKLYGITRDKNIKRAIDIVGNNNHYHPIIDRLESLEWDGVVRVRHLLPKYLGTEESDYIYEATRIMMMGAVQRVYNPGCKFEYMVCLVGGQGAGKSSFLRFLTMENEWFSDDLRKLDDENVFRKIQGHWIIEMAEMLATCNARSVEEIKSFLSRQSETYKVPYETHPEDRPRQCIFCGTSNNLKFLPMDRTGNRRFAPVLIHPEAAATHILANEKESRAYFGQMWAEAMEIYRSGNWELKLSDEMEKYVKELQKDFMPEDTKAGQIEAFLEKYEGTHVCTKMLFCEALEHAAFEDIPTWVSREIGEIMDGMDGWTSGKTHRFEKYGRQRSWVRIEECQQSLSTDREGFLEIPEQMEIPFD